MAIVGKWSLNGTANAQVGTNGTATNITWIDGKVNGAGSFNGGSSQINISDNNIYSFTNKICSFSAWVRTSSSSRQFIVSKGASSNYEWGFETSSGILYVTLWSNVGNPIWGAGTTTAINDGKWHFVTATINNNYPLLYVDGKEVAKNNTTQTSTTATNGTAAVRIGHRADGTGYWNGSIDEVEIHNSVLSPTEIKNKYLAYNGFI